MTCKQHPNYKIKREPISNCLECWKIWAKHLEEENKQYKILVKEINRRFGISNLMDIE